MIVLTRERLEALRTEKNGFTSATLKALGMKWNELERGWLDRLEGRQISDQTYMEALEGRTIFKNGERNRVKLDETVEDILASTPIKPREPSFETITPIQRSYLYELINQLNKVQAQNAIAKILEVCEK